MVETILDRKESRKKHIKKDIGKNTKVICIFKIIAILLIIQVLRILTQKIAFNIIGGKAVNMLLLRSIVVLLFTTVILLVFRKRKIDISLFPKEKKSMYIIFTFVILGLAFSGAIISEEYTISYFLNVIYSIILTPIFEEIIFRGYVWNKLEKNGFSSIITYVIVTLLFALWHLGYIDTIAIKVKTDFLVYVMFMKVVVGLCFGVVLGAVRLKTKNSYSTILLHSLLNIFGR